MTDFLKLSLGDGTEVLFQTAESDLVHLHGGQPEIKKVEAAGGQLEAIALAASAVAKRVLATTAPDKLQLEVGVGLSGEVGWFFAKSQVEASLNLTLTWKRELGAEPGES